MYPRIHNLKEWNIKEAYKQNRIYFKVVLIADSSYFSYEYILLAWSYLCCLGVCMILYISGKHSTVYSDSFPKSIWLELRRACLRSVYRGKVLTCCSFVFPNICLPDLPHTITPLPAAVFCLICFPIKYEVSYVTGNALHKLSGRWGLGELWVEPWCRQGAQVQISKFIKQRENQNSGN